MNLYLVLINALGLAVMYLDKDFARRRKRRIPERTLFLIAALGGSIGSILGMQLFRHKTQKPKFVWGMPAILTLQVLLFLFYGRLI